MLKPAEVAQMAAVLLLGAIGAFIPIIGIPLATIVLTVVFFRSGPEGLAKPFAIGVLIAASVVPAVSFFLGNLVYDREVGQLERFLDRSLPEIQRQRRLAGVFPSNFAFSCNDAPRLLRGQCFANRLTDIYRSTHSRTGFVLVFRNRLYCSPNSRALVCQGLGIGWSEVGTIDCPLGTPPSAEVSVGPPNPSLQRTRFARR